MADISALFITNVKQSAEALYREDFNALAIDAPIVESAKAVLENQRGANNVQRQLQQSPTDSVDAVWGTSDNLAVQDCTDDCELDGPKGTAETKTFNVPLCKEIPFSVSEEDARRSGRTLEQQTAFLLAQASVELDNWVNSQTLIRLKALADASLANALPTGYTQASGVITVPGASYNASMFADLLLMAARNRMGSPYMIDNGTLFTAWQNAQFNAGNLDGRGDAARFNALKMYWDLLGFFEAGLTEDTFIIKPGSVGLLYKTWNPDTPREIGGKVQQVRTTKLSDSIPGLKYDMFSEVDCSPISGSTRSDIVHTHKLKVNMGVHKAPGAGAARPAILALSKGA